MSDFPVAVWHVPYAHKDYGKIIDKVGLVLHNHIMQYVYLQAVYGLYTVRNIDKLIFLNLENILFSCIYFLYIQLMTSEQNDTKLAKTSY